MIIPKTYLSLLAVLFAFTSFSQQQELYIEYDLIYKIDNRDHKIELRSIGHETLSKMIVGSLIKTVRPNYETGELEEVGVGEYRETHSYIYQNSVDSTLFTFNNTFGEVIIKEGLDLMKWQLCHDKEILLGYTCQKATTQFRGRNYSVWFTTELPFRAAPWKIHGLPGVVLKVKTKDGFFEATANHLKIRKSEQEILNPYKKRKTIDWETYCKKYKGFVSRSENEVKVTWTKLNKELPTGIFQKPKIEIIIDAINRPGYDEVSQKILESSKSD